MEYKGKIFTSEHLSYALFGIVARCTSSQLYHVMTLREIILSIIPQRP